MEKEIKNLHKTTSDDPYSSHPTNSINTPRATDLPNPGIFASFDYGRCNTRIRRPTNRNTICLIQGSWNTRTSYPLSGWTQEPAMDETQEIATAETQEPAADIEMELQDSDVQTSFVFNRKAETQSAIHPVAETQEPATSIEVEIQELETLDAAVAETEEPATDLETE